MSNHKNKMKKKVEFLYPENDFRKTNMENGIQICNFGVQKLFQNPILFYEPKMSFLEKFISSHLIGFSYYQTSFIAKKHKIPSEQSLLNNFKMSIKSFCSEA